MAQEQSHATDAERGRLILGELIKSFCQRVAVVNGPFEKTTKLPVSRVRKILKDFLSAHAAHSNVPAVTVSNETVRIMTSLAYLMAASMAVVGWDRVPSARVGSNLKLKYMLEGTEALEEFDFLIDIRATAMEQARWAAENRALPGSGAPAVRDDLLIPQDLAEVEEAIAVLAEKENARLAEELEQAIKRPRII